MKKMTGICIAMALMAVGAMGTGMASAQQSKGTRRAPSKAAAKVASKANKSKPRRLCTSSKERTVVRSKCSKGEVDLGTRALFAICALPSGDLKLKLGTCDGRESKLGAITASAGGSSEYSCHEDNGCNCWGDDDCSKLASSNLCKGAISCDENNPNACHCD